MESIFSRPQVADPPPDLQLQPGSLTSVDLARGDNFHSGVKDPGDNETVLVGVDARGDGVATIRADSGRAARESREQEDSPKRRKKNGSHNLILVYL